MSSIAAPYVHMDLFALLRRIICTHDEASCRRTCLGWDEMMNPVDCRPILSYQSLRNIVWTKSTGRTRAVRLWWLTPQSTRQTSGMPSWMYVRWLSQYWLDNKMDTIKDGQRWKGKETPQSTRQTSGIPSRTYKWVAQGCHNIDLTKR